ncbi:hypothetical protein [Candidatus Nitrospira allomarina]|uniref:DUF4020 domain-containing protein n=1 Tax=Candidatus Nitrospira allomarina TaxID=3020900 RepID=A0AA96JRP8_9BACT|nr:hypothetical protein [Candidatus Nitrospira allomarina]WNM57328.1 hypothetical protein PP769_15315 [Candidatus Nitrospira allomarina]
MVTRLSARELDLLQRIDEKEELRPLFFRKVKGLKWFDPLTERGYFSPDANPKPVPAKEEGYVNIPFWPVVDYLVKTAPEFADKKNQEYAEKFLQVLVDVTTYAKNNGISNYRTWSQFAEILTQIPHNSIPLNTIDIVDYWLDDKYEQGLVAQKIGKKWLPRLLQLSDDHALQLAKRIIELLYKVIFVERKYGEKGKQESSLRFKAYHAQKITEMIARLAGEKLGLEAIRIFDALLRNTLEQHENDLWSSIWRPAIEDHEQNKRREDAGNVLIQAYRDSIVGYIRTNPEEASKYVKSMLESEYQTIQRIAIYVITINYHLFTIGIDSLLAEKYLDSNYRHEMWNFINKSYPHFSVTQKEKVLELIASITRQDDNGEYHAGATAYNKAIWLSAIKAHGDREAQLYAENTDIARTEPDHPNFSSYMSVRWGGRKSPRTQEELQALSIDELIQELENYKDPVGFDEPGLEGLVKVFKQLVKTEPLNFYLNLNKFINLDLAYIYEIIEAYRDLWAEKAKLPWDEIWKKLLDFCSDIITQERFWDPENAKQRGKFVANRYWIVSSIGQLIKAGATSDDHAFNERYLAGAEKLIAYLLNLEEGNEYKEDSDAVFISINSPRGHCLEALINLTLRSCRIADKNNNKDHSEIWAHFQHYYDSELDRADSKIPEYEFATLVTNYLPNFLYMSKGWILENLSRIFDQDHYLKWLCAMQGYAYVGTISQEIYNYLKEHGDLLKVLDDENIKDRVEERAIQNIAIAFINDFESFEEDNSLINILITRNDQKEISHLIWFLWTLKKKGDDKLKKKIYELWQKIQENIDLTTKEGRRMASQLCFWAVFIEQIDEERRQLLLAIAPFSDESHNSDALLESISEISKTQPFEAHEIWMKMLEGSTPDYPEQAVRKIFTNLLNTGAEGVRKAKEAESVYLKSGNDRPSIWLREIIKETRGM